MTPRSASSPAASLTPGGFARRALAHLKRPRATDFLLAIGLAAFGLAEAWPGYFPAPSRWARVDWVAYMLPLALTVTGTLPLAWRRTAPLAVLGVVGVSMAIWQVIEHETTATFFAMFIAVFSAGLYANDRRRSIGAFAMFAVVFVVVWVLNVLVPTGSFDPWFLFMLGFVGAIWFAGDLLRTRTVDAVESEQRASRLERERAVEAERAASEERARIARELHDVIAHSMSVVVIQAAAAVAVLDERPDEARQAMRQVEATARAAMAEMRRLLGVVRRADDVALTVPQPGVARLPDLVAELAPSGLDVRVDVQGQPRPLPAGVDVSVYRIVQEALTNTVRHARARRADVTIHYEVDAITVEVVDDGVGSDGGDGRGHGLIGMRERAELFDGAVHAAGRPDGGFEVRARLPARPVEAPAS